MLRIHCPWCGARDQTEFRFGGQAHLERPADCAGTTDAQWADYLFYRNNPKGMHFERWVHNWGCRQWFNVARNTLTHEILHVYAMGDPPPYELIKDRPPVPAAQVPDRTDEA